MTFLPRTGGRLLVDQLGVHGVQHVFCVPGESFLPVLDALHDVPMEVTVCRQEGGAAMMAEAAGKLTSRPGILFVTRGPGAANAVSGLHVASQDSTPLIMFVGQASRGVLGREAFQELDYRAVFGSIAKWVVEIDDPARIPEIVARAFHVAMQGRAGPVVVALPEDMLSEQAAVADAEPATPVEIHPGPSQMLELRKLLSQSQTPHVILGGSRWSPDAVGSLVRFAELFDLPVVTSFRRQMLFPADHPNYAGELGLGPNPRLVARLKSADCILLVGGRLSEVPSQSYELLRIPEPNCILIHVHPDASELNRIYHARLAIQATPVPFCAALDRVDPLPEIAWRGSATEAHRDYVSWSDPTQIVVPGLLQMGAIMAFLRQRCHPDTVFCNGAGNFATWLHRFWPYRRFNSQLAPTSGSMGYGVPAAVAAKRLVRERPVIVFAGDGDFLMTGQEFATAIQYELPIIVILLDNGMYGTIRMHQEREYPGRLSATTLRNPDFAALAAAFGGYGEYVDRTDQFASAFERAVISGKPAIIHCSLDPEAISPTATLRSIRENALLTKRTNLLGG